MSTTSTFNPSEIKTLLKMGKTIAWVQKSPKAARTLLNANKTDEPSAVRKYERKQRTVIVIDEHGKAHFPNVDGTRRIDGLIPELVAFCLGEGINWNRASIVHSEIVPAKSLA